MPYVSSSNTVSLTWEMYLRKYLRLKMRPMLLGQASAAVSFGIFSSHALGIDLGDVAKSKFHPHARGLAFVDAITASEENWSLGNGLAQYA